MGIEIYLENLGPWEISYAIRCELLHSLWGLLWLAPFCLMLTMLYTVAERGRTKSGLRYLLLGLSCFGLGLLSWGLHVFADNKGLGF